MCGMLEDVVVPSKRNVNGELYGFVRYSNVRDVSKLLKAVNVVCFGNFRVQAKVARFDRSANEVLVRVGKGEGAVVEEKGKKGAGEGENRLSVGEGGARPSVGEGKVSTAVLAVDEGVVGRDEVMMGKVRVRLDKAKGKDVTEVDEEALLVNKV